MKFPTMSAALLLAAIDIAIAAPAQSQARQLEDVVTLSGAGQDPPSYTISPPFDGSVFKIGASISH